MDKLQPKTPSQLFEATVNLELDYFINLLEEEMTLSEFGKRVSIKDVGDNVMAIYFDDYCIFTVRATDTEEAAYSIPVVNRFYLNSYITSKDSTLTSTVQ